MRYSLVDILYSRARALTALAALSLLSACASTGLPQSSFMATTGVQTAAPMGYLEFCARRPEQCGLNQVADAHGTPVDTELRAQDLRRRYYWSLALAGVSTPPPRLTPASGGGAASVSLDRFPDHSPDRSMWRGAALAPSLVADGAPRLDPTTWGGGASPLLQSAVLVTPAPAASPPSQVSAPDLFKPQPPPAPSAPSNDPYNLHDADDDAGRPVQPVALTPEMMTMFNGVNRHVNESIRYASARALYGNEDYWTLPLDAGGLRAGDCKDYVLEKRKSLVEQGVPSADLSIAVVVLRTGVAHAVLLVATDHGELVMDSLSSWILPWHELDYRWVSRQAPGQQLVWVKLDQNGRG
jgi:predicted transglutaminase-like cysteine proteinase